MTLFPRLEAVRVKPDSVSQAPPSAYNGLVPAQLRRVLISAWGYGRHFKLLSKVYNGNIALPGWRL